jgi:hypothetical protein
MDFYNVLSRWESLSKVRCVKRPDSLAYWQLAELDSKCLKRIPGGEYKEELQTGPKKKQRFLGKAQYLCPGS